MKGSLTIAACITNLRHDMQILKDNNPPDVEYYQVKRQMFLEWLGMTMVMWNSLEEVEGTSDKIISALLELSRKCE